MIHITKNRVSQTWRRWLLIFKRIDFIQIIPALMLMTIGVFFIYGTGHQVGNSGLEILWKKQIQWIIISLGLWLFLTLIHYKSLGYWSWLIYAASISMLILVLIPGIGVEIFGARRWLHIAGISMQPSEFAKTAVLILTSWLLSRYRADINKWKFLLATASILALPFGLILLEPDLGSAIVLLPMTAVLVLLAGLRWKYILIGGAVIIGFAVVEAGNEYFKVYPLLKEYQLKRIMVFLNPEDDIGNSGWHQYQAQLAVGSGGMYGKGYMQGTQNALGFLPETHTDFIFSVIAEETGFAGAVAMLALYAMILFSALRTAVVARDSFGRLLATGIAAVIFTHSVVNIGMSIKLMPVTGLPLPLVSYGGSFMLSTMIYLGILQSIYAHRKSQAKRK